MASRNITLVSSFVPASLNELKIIFDEMARIASQPLFQRDVVGGLMSLNVCLEKSLVNFTW